MVPEVCEVGGVDEGEGGGEGEGVSGEDEEDEEEEEVEDWVGRWIIWTYGRHFDCGVVDGSCCHGRRCSDRNGVRGTVHVSEIYYAGNMYV